MGVLNNEDLGVGSRICFGQWMLLAGCLVATLPVFASFLPINLGVDPRLEAMPMVLHLAAGICAIGLVMSFLQRRDVTLDAMSHPMVLAALFVTGWSVVLAPFVDYPWLSLAGTPVFGEAAVRYASLAVLFAAALVLAANRRAFVSLCAILTVISALAPVVMFAWGKDFFVSLDLVGYFAISAALGAWCLTDGHRPYLRCLLAVAAAAPAFALSTNNSVILVLVFAAAPAAVLTYGLLRGRVVAAGVIRAIGVLAVIAAPFVGLLLKWQVPELVDLPSIHSRHLLDKVLFAALMENPLIFAIGQGWGAINLTMDQHALSAGAVMWDDSWDLASRNISHSHSIYLEALFGAGVPAVAGFMMILAAPLLVVKADRLPLAVFATIALAGMATLTGESPATVGAVAMAFALAGVRPVQQNSKTRAIRFGRAAALVMPAVAASLLVAAFWQFYNANTIRTRVADIFILGPGNPHACDLHPHSALYADTELSQGLVRSYRPVLKRAAAGQKIPLQDFWKIDAYFCSARTRLDESQSASLQLALEVFRVDVALGTQSPDFSRRYQSALDNWPEKLVRVLTLAPRRTDVTIGFFLAQIQRGNFYTVASLAEALLKRDPSDPIALWFLGLARLASGEPANRSEGRRLIAQAIEGGVERFFPVAPETLEQLGVRDAPIDPPE